MERIRVSCQDCQLWSGDDGMILSSTDMCTGRPRADDDDDAFVRPPSAALDYTERERVIISVRVCTIGSLQP